MKEYMDFTEEDFKRVVSSPQLMLCRSPGEVFTNQEFSMEIKSCRALCSTNAGGIVEIVREGLQSRSEQ